MAEFLWVLVTLEWHAAQAVGPAYSFRAGVDFLGHHLDSCNRSCVLTGCFEVAGTSLWYLSASVARKNKNNIR
jgi:hypothetical protein